MSTNVTPEETMKSIIAKCWEDSEFKSQLIADPEATIEAFTGKKVELPAGVKLVVNDQSAEANTVYLNIPAEPNLDDLELSEEQLEVVSGGTTPGCITVALVILALKV